MPAPKKKPDAYLVRFIREGEANESTIIVNKISDAAQDIGKGILLGAIPIWEIKTGAAYK